MNLRNIAIRITSDNDEALIQFASQYPSIWCKEEPDLEKYCNRTHYHGYVQSELTNEGLKKQIYKYFQIPKEDQGNKTLAFTKIIEDTTHKKYKGGLEGYLRYICKGQENTYPNIVFNNLNYNTDEYYDAYWKINADYREEVKNRKEAKRTNKQNFKDWFIDNYINRDKDIGNRFNSMKLTQKNICLMMYEYYKEQEWELPSRTQGEVIIKDLYFRFSPEFTDTEELLRHYGIYPFIP